MLNDGGPAFPVGENSISEVLERGYSPEGMTMRQYYKASALQGLRLMVVPDAVYSDMVKKSVALYADSMLSEDEEFSKKENK